MTCACSSFPTTDQGSEQQALIFVLSSNQHRRDMTPYQRAAVAVDFMSQISEGVNQKRIEKLRETLARKAEMECSVILPNTPGESEPLIDARKIAARLMGVSGKYVSHAGRIKRASPELFEEVRKPSRIPTPVDGPPCDT